MPFERVTLFAILEFDYLAPAGALGHFYTDLPGNVIAERTAGLAIPAAATRRTIKLRLPGTVKGKKYQVKVTSAGAVILFGGRVYARPLGLGAEWAWYALPIPATGDAWSDFKLPIPATADSFSDFRLPIPRTAEEWSQVQVPMHKTPELLDWVDVPVAK
jgi:hypothetical protein